MRLGEGDLGKRGRGFVVWGEPLKVHAWDRRGKKCQTLNLVEFRCMCEPSIGRRMGRSQKRHGRQEWQDLSAFTSSCNSYHIR
jgi:hypothetical protein